jgi:hypothetical protein
MHLDRLGYYSYIITVLLHRKVYLRGIEGNINKHKIEASDSTPSTTSCYQLPISTDSMTPEVNSNT